jgi:hypothetical protein
MLDTHSALHTEDYFASPAVDEQDLCDRCDGDGFICKGCGEGEHHCACGRADQPDGTEICDWCFGEG